MVFDRVTHVRGVYYIPRHERARSDGERFLGKERGS
jgi:hypothetical protein